MGGNPVRISTVLIQDGGFEIHPFGAGLKTWGIFICDCKKSQIEIKMYLCGCKF
jgi:hypothetical protein